MRSFPIRTFLAALMCAVPAAAQTPTAFNHTPGPGGGISSSAVDRAFGAKQDFGGALDASTVGGVKLPAALAGKMAVGADMAGQPATAAAANTARGLGAHFGDVANVLDYGAVCDGASHPLSTLYPSLTAAQAVYPTLGLGNGTWSGLEADTAAIQSAVNRAQSLGSGIVFIPHGTCLSNATIRETGSGVRITGASDQTVIKFAAGTTDWISIGTLGGAQIANATIEDLYLLGTGAASPSAGIRASNTAFLHLDRVKIDGAWNGLALEQINTVDASHVTVNNHRGSCISLYANPAHNERSDGGDFHNIVCQGAFLGGDGIDIDGPVYAQRFYTTALLGEAIGLSVTNSAQSPTLFPSFLFFYGLETDGMSNASVVLASGYRIEFYNPEISNTSGAHQMPNGQLNTMDGTAFQCLPDNAPTNSSTGKGGGYTRQVRLIGGRVGNSAQSALAVNCLEFSVIGTTLGDASKSGNGNFPVVLIQSAAQDVLFEAARIGVQFGDQFVPSALLSIQNGATLVTAINNVFSGLPVASEVANASASATNHVVNNRHSDGSLN